jgi:hypothetical protein
MHNACEKKKKVHVLCALKVGSPVNYIIKKTSELGLMNKIKTFTNINKMFYKEASLGK